MKKFILSAVVMFATATTGVYAQSNNSFDDQDDVELATTCQADNAVSRDLFNIGMHAFKLCQSSLNGAGFINNGYWYLWYFTFAHAYMYNEVEHFNSGLSKIKIAAPAAYAYAEQLAAHGTLPDYAAEYDK